MKGRWLSSHLQVSRAKDASHVTLLSTQREETPEHVCASTAPLSWFPPADGRPRSPRGRCWCPAAPRKPHVRAAPLSVACDSTEESVQPLFAEFFEDQAEVERGDGKQFLTYLRNVGVESAADV